MNLKSFLSDYVNIIFGILIGISIGVFVIPDDSTVIEIPKIEYVETIKYDSIYIINDSIIEKIQYIEKQYEQDFDTIMSASDSLNLCIFTRYVEDYQRTIKNN